MADLKEGCKSCFLEYFFQNIIISISYSLGRAPSPYDAGPNNPGPAPGHTCICYSFVVYRRGVIRYQVNVDEHDPEICMDPALWFKHKKCMKPPKFVPFGMNVSRS